MSFCNNIPNLVCNKHCSIPTTKKQNKNQKQKSKTKRVTKVGLPKLFTLIQYINDNNCII